jgi:hypothetical protein
MFAANEIRRDMAGIDVSQAPPLVFEQRVKEGRVPVAFG